MLSESNLYCRSFPNLGSVDVSKFNKELFRLIRDNSIISNDLEAIGNRLPVKFAIAMRTTEGNLVLTDFEDNAFFIESPKTSGTTMYPNLIYDLGLQMCKYVIDLVLKEVSLVDLIPIIRQSMAYPVGAMCCEDYHLIVFHIVLTDTVLRDPKFKLFSGFKFVPIQTYAPKNKEQEELVKSLVIVQSEGEIDDER